MIIDDEDEDEDDHLVKVNLKFSGKEDGMILARIAGRNRD
jgi:hypothetical protein